MVKIKKSFLALIIGLLLSVYSCNYSDIITNKIPTDVTLRVFKVANTDTFSWPIDSSFAIDNIKRKIYNRDSLPFGTVLPRTMNFIITPYSFSKIIIEDASGKRDYTSTDDSINVTEPFKVTVKGVDSLITITYDVQINIRKTNPDTLDWKKITDNFYFGNIYGQKAFIHNQNDLLVFVNSGLLNYRLSSPITDGANWTRNSIPTLPPTARIESMVYFNGKYVVPTFDSELYLSTDGADWTKVDMPVNVMHIYGSVLNKATDKQTLILLGEKEGRKYFLYSDNVTDWVETNLEPTSNFPVSGSTSIVFNTAGYDRLSILGGVNSAGVLINDVYQMYFEKGVLRASNNLVAPNMVYTAREGASVIAYGDKWWWIMGGRTAPFEYSKEIYESSDNGFTWLITTQNIIFPATFDARRNASVLVDKHNYVWVIGGNNRIQHSDVWKGAVTRMIK